MTPFCKLYETEDYGQILVKLDHTLDAAEIRIYVQPEDLGVCSIAMHYYDDETYEGWAWDEAERQFAAFDLEKARNIARRIFEGAKPLLDVEDAAEEKP